MPDVLDRLTTALADRYRIERELGRGGMAIVYLAHDLKQGRQVAVKVVQPDLAAAIGGERFLNEIKVTANLQHPHILPLFDSGETDGFLYYVMPYVKGESLRALLDRKKQLPIDRALEITKAVASALGHAHRQGVIHRDIKPENILLADDGTALVADFGIALAVNEAGGTRLTETGISLGTPEYMSPEQATGDRQLDPASDIYSLGAVLYEMLTGDPPHTGNTAQAIIARLMMEQPTSIRLLRDTVPDHLEQAVMKALAKVPADRFDSAEAMVLQLAALATPSGGITLTETRRPATAPRFNFRNPVMLAVGALLALAVALGLWQGLGRGGDSDTALDPNLVAVMPFRTAGADPSLGYLREGMMDLLAAKLTGEGGPRAADPRTVLAAWRPVASADGADVSEEQAAGVARTIGAGQLLLGSVVGSPSRLVLSATLTSAGTPGATQATVEGPEDSLHVAGGLVDQLTGELLAGDAGVRGEFGGSLTTSSLEALKAYLDGQVAFRGGQYDEAVQHLSRAIGADSSFALAAFLLVRTGGWVVAMTDGRRVRKIAWDGRNRLGPRDRTLLEAYLGPRGSTGNRADVLEARERAVIAMPDLPDAWFLLGDWLFHEPFTVGGPDARERSVQAFERAVALDSTWVAPVQHLLEAATRGRDTREIRRLWELLVRLDSTSTDNSGLRFRAAVRLGDEEMIAEALDRLAAQWGPAALATVFAQRYREAVAYLDTLTAIMQSNALTRRERHFTAEYRYYAAMNRGRPREALGILLDGKQYDQAAAEQYLEPVLYWNGLLEDIELVLQRADSTARAPFGPTAAEQRGQLLTACRLAWWRLARGETAGVPFLLQRLEAGLIMGDSVVRDGASPHCTSLVRAMLAVQRGQADAMALVERVDSILSSYSRRRDYPIGFDVSYFTVAALFEELGEPERALAWVRRVGSRFDAPLFLSTKLREEGRLAALTGDRERAISAYGHYLELRSNPEPEVLPEVEAVRDELARLVGEPE